MSAVGPIEKTYIDAASKIARPDPSSSSSSPGGSVDFADTLTGALDYAESTERAAGELSTRFAAGEQGVGIHEVMIANGKANVAVRFAVTMKNRMLEAYRELMRTAI